MDNSEHYREAERRVEQARRTGAVELDLSDLKITKLPAGLAELQQLQSLDLSWCRQMQDLSPLAGLSALRLLDLSWCVQMQDLSPLGRLSALQSLDLNWCNQVQDLSPLAGLTALRSLALDGCSQVQDLSPLAGLSALRSLALDGCSQVQDLSPLAGLSALQSLNLGRCSQVQDLSLLAGLSVLQSLNLIACDQVQDLRPLAGLSALQSLNLIACSQLKDLSPLVGLIGLQSLNLIACSQLKDLSPLAGLIGLQSLNLRGCEQLQDLSPLSGLSALQSLDLNRCDQLQDLRPLARLSALQSLDLYMCDEAQDLRPLKNLHELKSLNVWSIAFDCDPSNSILGELGQLDKLIADDLRSAPQELASTNYDDNCLPRVRAWQADLLRGEATQSELKLFVLGNGSAGKTQICRRLCGQPYDEGVPSTHGITVNHFPLVGRGASQPAMQVRLWDFGGQDVYLSTHSLFLDERAVYLIVWTPALEQVGPYEESGLTLHRQSLRFWLDYVRALAGPKAPVIVVQSQCDLESQVCTADLPPDHGFHWLQTTECSAKNEDGLDSLLPLIKRATNVLVENHGKVRLPASWVAVGDALTELREHKGCKSLPLEHYRALCKAQQIHAPKVVLDYLHNSGQVFWKEDLFGNQLILDQSWALHGIYTVFNRTGLVQQLQWQGGLFTPAQLKAQVWDQAGYSDKEQALFLSLMQECGVCFEVTKDHYLAPDLLANQASVQAKIQQVWRDAEPNARIRLEYAFLHDGMARTLLSHLGKKAGVHAVYWRFGCCFYDSKTRATAQLRTDFPNGGGPGSVIIEAVGENSGQLAAALSYSVQEMFSTQSLLNIDQVVLAQGKEALNSSESDDRFSAAPVPLKADELRPVYVSYAWGGDSEKLVDRFEAIAKANSIDLRRDKRQLRPGDWISDFMFEIGRSDRVMVVFSEKYLRSPYCMRELLYLYQSSLGDKRELLNRIVPLIVGELNIDSTVKRLAWVRHWTNQHQELKTACKGLDPAALGGVHDELRLITEFYLYMEEMLRMVSDVLMPRGLAEIEKNDFEVLLERLKH